ncbi:MAG: hypothetical protein GY716_24400 [bacterium]|nr:hypothetical protein [bacterium]
MTPPFELDGQPDGSHVIKVEGFGAHQRRLGAPDVPHKTYLVAVPAGSVPRLEYTVGGEELYPGVLPSPVPRPVDEAGAGDLLEFDRVAAAATVRQRFEFDPAIYGGKQSFPSEVAWLGRVGVLRDQRYVEVHVAPLRFDPSIDGLKRAHHVDIVVHFDGGDPAGDYASDPRFESVYADAFVNYSQGKRFRLDRNSTGPDDWSAPRREPGAAGRLDRAPDVQALSSGGPTPRLRIRIQERGLIRLDHPLLQASGITAHPISHWYLENRGVQVPLRIVDDGNDLLGVADSVLFYAENLDDEPKTVLNTDFPGSPFDLFEYRDFTDENTYFLSVAGSAQSAMAELDVSPSNLLTPPDSFTEVAHVESDHPFGWRPIGGADPWYWWPSISNVGTPSRIDEVPLPGLYSTTASLDVTVQMRGVSGTGEDPDHPIRVTLKNALLDTLDFVDGSFDGRTLHTQQLAWNHVSGPGMLEPAKVELTCLDPPTGRNDVILDYIEVEYPRSFAAIGDQLLINWPNADAEFVVTGLSVDDPDVYEVTKIDGTEVITATRLTGGVPSGAGPFSFRFEIAEDPGMALDQTRRFLVVADGVVPTLDAMNLGADLVSDLRLNSNQADMVVIAHPDLVSTLPGSELSLLLAHRASAAGGNVTSKVAWIQDVYDEFGHGIPGTQPIREFIRYVLSDAPGEGWADPRPAYVLLIGDSSYEFKAGTAEGTYIPTQILFKDDPILGYYASDSIMAAVIGDDDHPDLEIGRIPARTSGEADVVIAKIRSYETVSPAGDWRNHALLISDRGSDGEGDLDFEMTNDQAIGYIEDPGYTSRHLKYFTDYYDNPGVTDPIGDMNIDIKAAVNGDDAYDGASVLQYGGHGNSYFWSNDGFLQVWDQENPDTDDLTNSPELPWLMAHNCLTGSFHEKSLASMGENWLKRDVGGAVGVFSPAALSFNAIGNIVTDVIWDAMYGARRERVVGNLAALTHAALCTDSIEACQSYIVQGDPAMRIGLRLTEPATNVSATPGNVQVTIDWTASDTPDAEYLVYRTSDLLNANYILRTPSPIDATQYVDTLVTNNEIYYYYVVAVDPEGFRSAWSHLNSDCDNGPDCLIAIPTNPDPPSIPSGLAIGDPGQGTQLRLDWTTNPEPDVEFYTVHYGTAPGDYSVTLPIGNTNTAIITGLTEGQEYYFAISATNTSDKTSAVSNEVIDFPKVARGLRAPRFIEDLFVRPSGNDMKLEWTEVTSDIFGKPKSVDIYEVFRGEVPNFSAGGLTKIGQCSAPCNEFFDAGAALASASYYYRVLAVDGDGTPSGFGSELPGWTDLSGQTVDVLTGEILLQWTPVTLTVDGRPTTIKHYLLYAADAPFTREDIRDGSGPAPVIVEGTSTQFTPPGQSRYYSVLAVDAWDNLSPF